MRWREDWWRSPLAKSLALHGLVIIALSCSFDLPARVQGQSQANKKIIQAVKVDAKALQQQLDEIAKQKQAKARALRLKQERIKKMQAAAIKAKQARQQEEIRLKQLAAKRREQEQKREAEQQAAAKHLARLRSERKKEQQRLAELQKQQAAQQAAASRATQQRMRGLINRYQGLIKQAITQHWIFPPGVDKHASSILRVRLAPGGEVIDVQLTRGSGIASLDRSAIAAVYKASPLPVPSEPEVFDKFRELSLTMRPEDILETT